MTIVVWPPRFPLMDECGYNNAIGTTHDWEWCTCQLSMVMIGGWFKLIVIPLYRYTHTIVDHVFPISCPPTSPAIEWSFFLIGCDATEPSSVTPKGSCKGWELGTCVVDEGSLCVSFCLEVSLHFFGFDSLRTPGQCLSDMTDVYHIGKCSCARVHAILPKGSQRITYM